MTSAPERFNSATNSTTMTAMTKTTIGPRNVIGVMPSTGRPVS